MIGKRSVLFPETLNAERSIEVEGKQNSLFPVGPVIKCSVTPPDSKTKINNCKKNLLGTGWHTNLPQFQGAQTGHVQVKS